MNSKAPVSRRKERQMLDHRTETFLKVCETMNFTAAASALHMTQPAVSQHIRALEKSYGCRIFVYEQKQLRLTEEGKILLNAAKTMRNGIRNSPARIRKTHLFMTASPARKRRITAMASRI